MKSNKNFQKSKKANSFDSERDSKVKKVGASSKKTKYFKKEIFDELDELGDIDLFEEKEDFLEEDEDSDL